MLSILEETLIDTIKLVPFLFITYLIMEYIEHKMSEKSKQTIKKSGKWGPIIGSVVGAIPQCGFSVSATNLYAARVISLGTLISVYLSTSDEMIPIFISEAVPSIIIVKIIAIKVLIGMICGFIIDLCLRMKDNVENSNENIGNLCENEHCHCDEKGILKSSIKHTVNILIYIFIITLIINIMVDFIGEDNLASIFEKNTIFGPIFASLIGLIPNCAASVIITNLFIQNIITAASLIAGLLTGAGVGLIVLFRINHNLKENIKIILLLYGIGAIVGIILQYMNFVI